MIKKKTCYKNIQVFWIKKIISLFFPLGLLHEPELGVKAETTFVIVEFKRIKSSVTFYKEDYFFIFSTWSFARARAKTLAETSFVMVEPAAI